MSTKDAGKAPSKTVKSVKTTKIPKKSKAAADAVGPDGKPIKHKKRNLTYNTYIYRTLKHIHDLGISGRAMLIMNSLVNDMFDRIAREAANLARINHRNTLTPPDIDAAVKLIFPGELADHAISEGGKAVQKYAISQQTEDEPMA